MSETKRKRRWLRYSLRSMLVVVLALSIFLGWMANRAAKQRRAVALVRELGGTAYYDYQFDGMHLMPEAEPPGPAWLREKVGLDWFSAVGGISFGTSLEPPHNDAVKVTDQQLAQMIDKLSNLRMLYIWNTTVVDSGLKCLESQDQLKWLVLGRNVTDAGLRHIRYCKDLEGLLADRAAISDEGLQQLCQLPKLETLSLGGFQITDGGISQLSRLTHLRTLLLHKTNVTDEGINELQEALPDCQVMVRTLF